MLETLLRILAVGGAHGHKELARRLGISETLLDTMLDDLVRMGYLHLIRGSCCTNCEHCPMGDACAVGDAGRVWVLTEAGRRVAR